MDFEEYFESHLPSAHSFHPYFDEALTWILKAGGKHFRANLIIKIARELGFKDYEKAYGIALGVELLHAYSLIHDDLPAMDNASLRRGVETIHTKFDEATAILVGDALNTHAFYEIATCDISHKKRCKIAEILAYSAGVKGMVLGQAIDCHFEGQKLDLKKLTFLHNHKTGALIAACVQIAAILADKKHRKHYYDLGLKIGLAFQINDDIIDATKSQDEAGKPVSHDTNKNSFVNLLGLESAREYLADLRAKIIKSATKLNIGLCVAELIQNNIKG